MITLVGSVSRLKIHPADFKGRCEEEPEMIIWDKVWQTNAVS